MNNAYIYDFQANTGGPTSGTFTATTTSASVTLPAGIETVILIASAAIHFRFTVGASTAVQSDPMIVSGMSPLVVKLPQENVAWTLSAITDSVTAVTGNQALSWSKVAEA